MQLNLPNILTLCRFVLIPVYAVVFINGYLLIAFCVVVLAGLTDVLDGYLARKWGQVTQMGSMLDPLADKSLMLVVILTLLYKGFITWHAAAAMFIRDVSMIIGSAFFHFRGKKTVPANGFGKLTTVLYYVAFALLFFQMPYAQEYLWSVIAVSFLATGIYIAQFRTINQKRI